MIRLLKSSAGSGKTFNLAKTYISFLLRSKDPQAYRHVLAVTFTNKATGEMKSRILKELAVLAEDPSKSDYIVDLRKEFGSDEEILKWSKILLVNILHDYGSFCVSTIDKFFQRTLKSFAREVGQYASYQVELDKNSLVEESVDRVLSSVNDEDKDGRSLLGWLSESAMDDIETSGRFSLEKSLYRTAKGLLSDEHREIVEEYGIDEEAVYSKENLAELRKKLSSTIKNFENSVREAASAAVKVFADAGVSFLQTSGAGRSPFNIIPTLADKSKPITKPSDSFFKKAPDPDLWFKKDKSHDGLVKDTRPALDHFERIIALFETDYKDYKTAKTLYSGLHGLGILAEIRQQFHDLMKEKNVLSIDDSNVLLRKIIGNDKDNAPFIYEKLGITLEHFLLDEFQDTSNVQWDNFLPLLKESESNSDPKKMTNLIVGDVKQSIYRFRGSDWNLLDHEVKEEFPSADDSAPLTQNWRSLREVVTFNNRFFHFAAGVLDTLYGKGDKLRRIYSDVMQEAKARDNSDGSVRVSFCENADTEKYTVLASVDDAIKRGAKYGDIAILVRGNGTGSLLAGLLVENGIPVVSDDSLKVSSSIVVRRLVSLLSLIQNPEDKVGRYMTGKMGIVLPQSWYSLVDLAENLLRKMKAYDPESFTGAVPYVMAFMDDLQEWTTANGNNLGEYLRHWGKTDLTISSPVGSDAVRIITVHKAKGLEFPYVIMPMAENVKLFKAGKKWVVPETESTFLEGTKPSAFSVKLSSSSEDTLFSDDFENEMFLQYVDNMNIFYVALTRAGKELHVISSKPSEECRKSVQSFDPADYGSYGPFSGQKATDFSQILYLFLGGGYANSQTPETLLEKYLARMDEEGRQPIVEGDPEAGKVEEFYIGSPYDYSLMKRDKKDYDSLQAGYPSTPVSGIVSADDDEEEDDGKTSVASMGRLRFRSDAADFFKIGSEPGIGSSPRLRGIVLHDILSRVAVPSDLSQSVELALRSGDLDSSDAEGYRAMLSSLIASVSSRGWFPTDPTLVSNESSIISLKGKVFRPDRVVKDGDTLKVIDYKFVEDIDASREKSEEKYIGQVSGYMDLYRSMGWLKVKGAIWYISLSERGTSHVTDID